MKMMNIDLISDVDITPITPWKNRTVLQKYLIDLVEDLQQYLERYYIEFNVVDKEDYFLIFSENFTIEISLILKCVNVFYGTERTLLYSQKIDFPDSPDLDNEIYIINKESIDFFNIINILKSFSPWKTVQWDKSIQITTTQDKIAWEFGYKKIRNSKNYINSSGCKACFINDCFYYIRETDTSYVFYKYIGKKQMPFSFTITKEVDDNIFSK